MDPKVSQLIMNGSNLCKAIGAVMLMYGLNKTYASFYFWLGVVGGGFTIVVPVILDSIMIVREIVRGQAVGVQAGINLVLAGEAKTTTGNKITEIGLIGAPPPLPVTLQSAQQIVKDCGPVEPIQKA